MKAIDAYKLSMNAYNNIDAFMDHLSDAIEEAATNGALELKYFVPKHHLNECRKRLILSGYEISVLPLNEIFISWANVQEK